MASKTTFIEYYWPIEGEEARFGVELSLYKTAPDSGHPLLVYMCFQTRSDEDLTNADRKRAEDISKKCAKRTGIIPAGFIEAGSQRQYYFYLADQTQYGMLKDIAAREKKLVCRIGGKTEENWVTYFNLLYPDERKYQTVKNGEQIRKMERMGDNSSAARRINLHVGFKTEQQRIMFEEAARHAGFAIGNPESQPENEYPNGAVVHRISTLERREIDAVTLRVIGLAAKEEGKLLYWDCNIVPKSVTKRL